MDRVSSTAAALLALDPAGGGQHVGWLAQLDPADRPLDLRALLDRIGRHAAAEPRLRQVPAGLVWRDDAAFDLARHVTVHAETPVGEDELRDAVDAFVAAPLSPERPLWRLLVVPITRGGGAAIAAKHHRALADAGDASPLHDLVFDASAAPISPDALALDEMRALRQLEALGGGRTAGVPRIGATLRRAALSRTVGPLVPAPPSFLDAEIRRRATIVTARVERARIERIAERAEATSYDVVLAILAGTLRRLALASGVVPTDLRALVPVTPEQASLLGDAPCAVLDLPIAERRAARRLTAVSAAMAAATRPRGGEEPAPTVLAGPPEELPTRLALGARVCNVTVPSACGPELPLHVGGVRVRALFPLAPLPEEHALAVGTLSYDRHVHVGVAADAAAVRGVRRLAVMLADAVEELGLSTGARVGGVPLGTHGNGRHRTS